MSVEVVACAQIEISEADRFDLTFVSREIAYMSPKKLPGQPRNSDSPHL